MSGGPVHRNQLWADVLVAELARGGLDHVAVSPGSRSAPLAVALHRHPRVTLSVHPDERSGAFFALGRARESGRPVGVLTTSGSAVANVHPGVVEARYAGVPLVVVSADRPPHLQAVGANQTIDQSRLLERETVWNHDLGLPRADAKALRYLRAVAGRALAHARGPPPGAVHLNVPFDEPLAPDPVPGDVPPGLEAETGGRAREGYLPWLAATSGVRWPEPAFVDAVADRITGRPGVIVAGPRHRRDPLPAMLVRLARSLGAPVFADPLSGARFQKEADEHVLATADALCSVKAARDAFAPEWVLHFGATPTSRHVLAYLEEHPEAWRVVIDETGRHPDAVATAHVSVHADASRFALMLQRQMEDRAAVRHERWLHPWLKLEDAARRVLDSAGAWEATVPARTLVLLPSGGLLWVGSSLPVRDLDRYTPRGKNPKRVLSNRGASGIDGSVSSAVGAAAGHGGPAFAVIGDVALAHDSGALAAMRKNAPELTLVVVNNGGGAIFGGLPIAKHEPPFTELFLTPPECDIKSLAQAHRLRHRIVGETEPLAFLRDEPGGIVEVPVDRERSVERRAHVQQRLEDAVRRSIG